MRRSIVSRLYTGSFSLLNRFVEWHRLPRPLAILNLISLRIVLRAENLHDTNTPGAEDGAGSPEGIEIPDYAVSFRTEDGSFNDLDHPEMGRTGERFARNFPLQ